MRTLNELKAEQHRLEQEIKKAKKARISQIISDVDEAWLSGRDTMPVGDVKQLVRLMAQWVSDVME